MPKRRTHHRSSGFPSASSVVKSQKRAIEETNADSAKVLVIGDDRLSGSVTDSQTLQPCQAFCNLIPNSEGLTTQGAQIGSVKKARCCQRARKGRPIRRNVEDPPTQATKRKRPITQTEYQRSKRGASYITYASAVLSRESCYTYGRLTQTHARAPRRTKRFNAKRQPATRADFAVFLRSGQPGSLTITAVIMRKFMSRGTQEQGLIFVSTTSTQAVPEAILKHCLWYFPHRPTQQMYVMWFCSM